MFTVSSSIIEMLETSESLAQQFPGSFAEASPGNAAGKIASTNASRQRIQTMCAGQLKGFFRRAAQFASRVTIKSPMPQLECRKQHDETMYWSRILQL